MNQFNQLNQTLYTRWLNPQFLAAQIPIANKYLEFGYKGLVFCTNEIHGQGTHSIKMSDDELAKDTLNCLSRPKVWAFEENW